jgi:two-component system OmpR family sensor kinase
MNLSLRSRLWMSFGVVILLMVLIIGGMMLVYIARGNLVARLRLQAVVGQLAFRQEIPLLDKEAAQQVVARIDDAIGMRTIVLDREGGVVVDSRISSAAGFSIFQQIPRSLQSGVFRIEDLDGYLWLYTGRPLTGGYTLVVALQRQPLREIIGSPVTKELLQALGISGVVAVVLSMILAGWAAFSVAKPLQRISQAVSQTAEGNLIRVEPDGPREVRQLGESFNRMAEKVNASQKSQRDFVANVSHELKTPLTSVQGFAQAIIDGTAAAEEDKKQAAQVIFEEAGRMHRMVVDLLDLAKLDAGTADLRRERLELAPLLQRVVERFTPQSREARVELVSRIDPLPALVGDGDRLVQVFTNLVDNALKHTPPGGRVTLNAASVKGEAEIWIEDTGAGIPPKELSRIFERFYQMDKARQGGPRHGAGLGLAIAQEIVQAHDGQMSVTSREGQGSRFTVRLPFARPDDETLVAKLAR